MRWIAAGVVVIVIGVVIFTVFVDEENGTTTVATTTTTTASTATTTTTTVSPATTSTLRPGETVCDVYGDVEVSGRVVSDDLVEASGIAVGRVNAGMLWAHNDSRDGARLYAVGLDGADLGVFDVAGAVAFDWEDMAIGPGPTPDQPYLYVGDIGDNFAIRDGQVTVYRLPEPSIGPGADPVFRAEALVMRYPDGESPDAEALFVDPTDAALYIVTRNPEVTRVYRAEAAVDAATVQDLSLVVALPLGDEVTGADILGDGSLVAFRGEDRVWLWPRTAGQPIADALAVEPCSAPSPDERQGEAIAFDEGGSYFTLSEGTDPEIHVVRREGS